MLKNKILIAMLLIIAVFSITAYAKGCLNSGAQVTRGDAVDVCCSGHGLVNICVGNQTCNSNVYCAGTTETQNIRIFNNMKRF